MMGEDRIFDSEQKILLIDPVDGINGLIIDISIGLQIIAKKTKKLAYAA